MGNYVNADKVTMSHRITRSDLLRALDSPAAVSACVALPSRLESVRQTRRFVSDQLGRWRCESLTDSTVRICRELAANAVTHAEPDAAGRGEILVSLTFVAGEALIAQVADSDPSPPVPKITRPQGLAESGRGLSIVTKLCDYWSASPRSDGQGKTVSAYLRDHQQALAPGAASAADRALPPPAGQDRVPSEDAAGLVAAAEAGGTALPPLEFSKPTVARVCDYVTGGTDNYPADRALGRQLLAVAPWLDRAAAAARAHGPRPGRRWRRAVARGDGTRRRDARRPAAVAGHLLERVLPDGGGSGPAGAGAAAEAVGGRSNRPRSLAGLPDDGTA